MFNVLSANPAAEAEKKKRKRKKKGAAKKDAEDATVDAIAAACKAKGFSDEDISRGRSEMFEKGLAHDNEAAVLTFLDVRKKMEEQRKVEAEAAKKKEVGEVAKKQQEVKHASAAPTTAESKGNTGGSNASTKERLLNVIQNVEEIGAILEGIKLWFQNAKGKEKEVVFEQGVLEILFRKIFEKVSSMATISSALITSLERQLVDVLKQMLQVTQKEIRILVSAVNSLVASMLKIREINSVNKSKGLDPVPVEPVARAAASALLEIREARGSAGLASPDEALRNPARIDDIQTGLKIVEDLEKIVVPVVPRGDAVSLNKSGKLSAGDVARLFKLRDNGRKLVDASLRCVELSATSPIMPLQPTTTAPKGLINAMILGVRDRIKFLGEHARKAKADFDTAMSTQPGEAQPFQERIGAIRQELGTLKEDRLRLMAQLENIDQSIVSRSEELRQLEGSLTSTESERAQTGERLKEAAQTSLTHMSVEEMKLHALNSVKQFYDVLLQGTSIGVSTQVSTKPVSSPVSDWRSRTILSVERYLGVEVTCVELLEKRVEMAKVITVELQGKIQNLMSLNMQTLVEEAKARLEQENKNAIEDERALIALKQSAEKVLGDLFHLFRDCKRDSSYSFSGPVASALHRCSGYAQRLGLANPFANVLLPDEPIEVSPPPTQPVPKAQPVPEAKPVPRKAQAPKPPAPAPIRRGWGAVAQTPVAPSFMDILEEEKRKEAAEQPPTQQSATEETPSTNLKKDADEGRETSDIETVETPHAPETPKAVVLEEANSGSTTNDEPEMDSKDEAVNDESMVDEKIEEEGESEIQPASVSEITAVESSKSEQVESEEPQAGPDIETSQGVQSVDPEFAVYENDAALGQKCPSLSGLEFFNGDSFDVGQGKIVIITFFSKLNKSDYCTLTVLNRIRSQFNGQVEVLGVSRDSDGKPDKFLEKYQGKYMAEAPAPNNDETLKTVQIDYPLAHDEGSKFNSDLKSAMKRAVAGVGLAVIVDGDGTIKWYEQFVRGVNPANQFVEQLKNVVEGLPLLSNGPAPVEEEEEIDDGVGEAIPDDVDVFASGGNY